MKTTNNNTQNSSRNANNSIANPFSHETRTRSSWKARIARLGLFGLFLCGLMTTASAQGYTWVKCAFSPSKPAGGMAGIQGGVYGLWGRAASGQVYRFVDTDDQYGCEMQLVESPAFAHIGVSDTTVWGLTSSGAIYYYNGSSFVNVPGPALSYIGAGGNGGVWGISSSGAVYVYDGITFGTPYMIAAPPAFDLIFSGDAAQDPWAIDASGNAWTYTDTTDGPEFVETSGATNLKQISVGLVGNGTTTGEIWGISTSGQAFEYDTSTGKWIEPDTNAVLSEISVDNDGNTWAVNSSGKLFIFYGKKFINYEQPPVNAFQVRTIGGVPYVLAQTTGNVYFLANQSIP